MAKPENIEVECLTDESGTDWMVSFYVGREKVYSREMPRRSSAEKVARIMREAFPSSTAASGVEGTPASVPDKDQL